MRTRLPRAAAAIALLLAVAGCAVGHFITGAPASGSMAPARALLVRRCSSCHATPDPASMSGADWQAGLSRMKGRMRLPASEWDSLAAMESREVRP